MPPGVLKIGGSVFCGRDAYEHVARRLRDRLAQSPDTRLLVVVSAENGTTDALLAQARAFSPEPPGDAMDLLWSTGELRSVALLTLALRASGVSAAGLNVHQAGLLIGKDCRVLARLGRVRRAFSQHAVVVVPGFLAATTSGSIVSLGRGGSDLSAVLFARALGASACELIKDVPGWFTSDPHQDAGAEHLASVSYAEAIEHAATGCRLVQRRAIEAAAEAGLRLVIRTLADDSLCTIVGPDEDTERQCCGASAAAARE